MDLKEKLIRLAHANPELRPKILPLLKRTAVVKPQKSLMIESWKILRVKDSWKDGEMGRREHFHSGKGDSRRFKNIKEIASYMDGHGVPDDKNVWGPEGIANGVIFAGWTGGENGLELSKREMEDWKAGTFTAAYTYSLQVHVLAASVYTPSAKELKAWR